VRSLAETITLAPVDGKLRVEVRGERATILRLAEGARHAKHPGDTGALAAQIKLVAGARNHLYRTQFLALSRRQQGFESPTGRQAFQAHTESAPDPGNCCGDRGGGDQSPTRVRERDCL
jgi:hypothetical protein